MSTTLHLDRRRVRLVDEGNGWWHIITLDTCERCEKDSLAPNAFRTDAASAAKLLKAGFQQIEKEPPELYWSDAFGGVICQPCYDEVQAEEGTDA